MRSNTEIQLEQNEDDETLIDDDDLGTVVCLDVTTGQLLFESVQEDEASDEVEQCSVVLALDCEKMKRYAMLDEMARMRVREILRDTVQHMLEQRLYPGQVLTVELTDAMFDTACRLQ